jgi:hypothetical protein
MKAKGKKAAFQNFWRIFQMSSSMASNAGYIYFSQRPKTSVLSSNVSSNLKGWKQEFFFVRGPDSPLSEDDPEPTPHEWPGAKSWIYGKRRLKGDMIHEISDEFLQSLQADPHQTPLMTQEAVLRLAELSTCSFPALPIDYGKASIDPANAPSTLGASNYLDSSFYGYS